MKQIENLLQQTIGLNAASIGPSLIHRAIRSRMRSVGIRKVDEYRELLQKSTAEWHELVESVLVAETWFFRDREQFDYLVPIVVGEWLPKNRTGFFRALSLPCSSGEEPYSLVMALRDAGFPLERLRLDAVDISSRALARAVHGVYRRNSFRGHNLAFRDQYFQSSKEGYVLSPDIKSSVNFYAANLLSGDFSPVKESYDCIFCRNLLIYFDPDTQQKALEKIERLLRPGGVLLVGPAEPPLVADRAFARANSHKAFAFRKMAPHAPHIIVPRAHRTKAVNLHAGTRHHPANGTSHRPILHSHTPVRPASSRPVAPDPNRLDLARQYADAGKLSEAAEICEAHLRKRADCAEAYYLLGLIRDAAGDDSAVDCYRRALYLEPNHYESLLQMAMLSQKNGDLSRARTFKNRAQRVKGRS